MHITKRLSSTRVPILTDRSANETKCVSFAFICRGNKSPQGLLRKLSSTYVIVYAFFAYGCSRDVEKCRLLCWPSGPNRCRAGWDGVSIYGHSSGATPWTRSRNFQVERPFSLLPRKKTPLRASPIWYPALEFTNEAASSPVQPR